MNLLQQKQQGFSLIEMMVAILIGLFLMGGVISVYISSSQSSKVNEGLRAIQENGRFALNSLREGIQMGGYLDTYDPTVTTTMSFPFDSSTSGNNSIAIAYEGTTDCAGNTVTAVDSTSGRVLVQNSYSLNTTTRTLECTGNGAAGATPIIEGVDAIRIMYGLDDDNDKIADRYVLASSVAANEWANNISSVRIALLMNSGISVKQTAESLNYQLLDQAFPSPNDRMLRKVFSTTILLRNRMS